MVKVYVRRYEKSDQSGDIRLCVHNHHQSNQIYTYLYGSSNNPACMPFPLFRGIRMGWRTINVNNGQQIITEHSCMFSIISERHSFWSILSTPILSEWTWTKYHGNLTSRPKESDVSAGISIYYCFLYQPLLSFFFLVRSFFCSEHALSFFILFFKKSDVLMSGQCGAWQLQPVVMAKLWLLGVPQRSWLRTWWHKIYHSTPLHCLCNETSRFSIRSASYYHDQELMRVSFFA